MNMNLSLYETRVLGCLIEKAISTPDQYPLSLNALVNACNQKSNRDPVMELKETELESLATRDEPLVLKLPREPGKREPRYAHLFSGKTHAQSLSARDGEETETFPSDINI